MTEYATSSDGTRIGFDREGSGPPVILIDGAFQFRAFDPVTTELQHQLAAHGFEVVRYDRRGRGESRADAPITLAQTVEDLRALIEVLTEGSDDAVTLFGNSSGGAIALAAAAAGLPVSKIVVFEVPLDPEAGAEGAAFLADLRDRIAFGDGAATVEFFMRDMPPEWLEQSKASDAWPVMTALAPSLEPDAEVLAWTQSAPRAELWRDITQPVLVLVGSQTLGVMGPAADSLVADLAHAERRELEASDHLWDPRTLALVIAGFLVDGPVAGDPSGA
ncbi:alpha/beta fold hydrolase [Agromyces aerolatus]|uniref:alpha/beta fold hydrolase n=1 Tax=Agromyces sp. LY-1074 TaxID=3074080 RepID=UPI002861A6A0|nr:MULTISPECIES: alpha/beta fold hydrolase [unclassified Agromyces]MDR5699534.1 alpha/beta fold hydrolase [Agromyces sp. LY-1074]MDR5705830.1 alpha/beta fold hydrolase [Agromyces sp. LY-1358]